MEANVYIVIKLDWYYFNITVTFSMPNYVCKALHIFQHILMGGKSTPPISALPSNMDIKFNMLTLWMHQSNSPTNKLTSFNKFVELSCIIQSLSTTLFSQPLVTFPWNSQRALKTLQNRWPGF